MTAIERAAPPSIASSSRMLETPVDFADRIQVLGILTTVDTQDRSGNATQRRSIVDLRVSFSGQSFKANTPKPLSTARTSIFVLSQETLLSLNHSSRIASLSFSTITRKKIWCAYYLSCTHKILSPHLTADSPLHSIHSHTHTHSLSSLILTGILRIFILELNTTCICNPSSLRHSHWWPNKRY